jgi:YbbR domain-containing protein
LNGGQLLVKITEKWPAKILSLAAALIIFVFYRLSTLETRVLTIPLKVEAAESLIPENYLAHTVRVTLRGEINNILTITENDIEAYIDLNRYVKEGTYRIPIQIRKAGNALAVEPLEISITPAAINLTLEEKITRYIDVYPILSGDIASGYEIKSQFIIPESVIAEGPRSSLDKLKEFSTNTIDLDGRSGDFTILVPIKNDNPNITIHGSKLIEYNCTISRIERNAPVVIIEQNGENIE